MTIVTQAAMDGGDGSWAYGYGNTPVTTTTISLALDEDQIGDSERGVTNNQVSYFVFEKEGILP